MTEIQASTTLPVPPPPVIPPPAPRSSGKTFLIFLGLFFGAGILAAPGFIIWQRLRPAPVPQAPAPALLPSPTPFSLKAKIEYLTGSAWKVIDGRRLELKENDVLAEGDHLITEADTLVVLAFDDGSLTRVGAGSDITLPSLKPALMTINQTKGIIFARVNKDDSHRFVVQAGNIRVESKGTVFAVENTTDVKVKVFESEVTITTVASGSAVTPPPVAVKTNQEWQASKDSVKPLKLEETAKDAFFAQSLEATQLLPTLAPKPTAKPTPKPESGTPLTLTGQSVTDGIALKWTVNGTLDVGKGFKVVKGKTQNPTYPLREGDEFQYLSDPASRSLTWKIKDGQTYYFRVCRYLGDTCDNYSNNLTVTAPLKGETPTGQVKSLSLSGQKSGDRQVHLTWTVDGTSSQGYKVVWSKTANPTYPLRDGDKYHYLTDPNDHDDDVTDLETGHTYHFRVCEYLGGRCGVYSNDVSIGL